MTSSVVRRRENNLNSAGLCPQCHLRSQQKWPAWSGGTRSPGSSATCRTPRTWVSPSRHRRRGSRSRTSLGSSGQGRVATAACAVVRPRSRSLASAGRGSRRGRGGATTPARRPAALPRPPCAMAAFALPRCGGARMVGLLSALEMTSSSRDGWVTCRVSPTKAQQPGPPGPLGVFRGAPDPALRQGSSMARYPRADAWHPGRGLHPRRVIPKGPLLFPESQADDRLPPQRR